MAYRRRGLNGEAKASSDVMINPFSPATTKAVIPDGKATMSLGQRLQSIKELQAGTDATQPLTCILFPGFGNCISWFNDSSSSAGLNTTNLADRLNTVDQPFTNHGGWIFQPIASGTTSTSVPLYFGSATQLGAQGFTSNWRTVSVGLKLQLTNNADQNDGWWESVRLSPSNDPTQWCFADSAGGAVMLNGDGVTPNTNTKPGDGRVNARGTGWKSIISESTLVDNPTYQSGKLRDIHQHVFKLKAINTDHDFRELKSVYNFLDNTVSVNNNTQAGADGIKNAGAVAGATTPYTVGASVVSDAANVSDFVNGNVDFSHDIILIRLWGRPSTVGSGSTVNTPTRILSHVVCNQEIVYQENTFLERFHERAPLAPGAVKKADAVNATVIGPATTPGTGPPTRRRGTYYRRPTFRRTSAVVARGIGASYSTYRRTPVRSMYRRRMPMRRRRVTKRRRLLRRRR